jgi:transposase
LSIIDIIKGRTTDVVTEFLKSIFPQKQRNSIKAVSIDMSRTFKSAIANSFPFADVIINRFHIAQHLNQQVDNARKHIQNKIRKEENNKHKV